MSRQASGRSRVSQGGRRASLPIAGTVLFALILIRGHYALGGDASSTVAEVDVAQTAVKPPPIDFRILDQGGPRMITTNWGYIGNNFGGSVDSATGEPAIPFEYPAWSRIKYLYDAGLWVGGIVDGDTLVSTGTWGYLARHELFPDSGAAGKLVFDDYLSDVGYRAMYADTFTNPNIAAPDGIDGLHRPLNVQIRQESRAWSDAIYRDMVWMQVTVKNVGARTIHDAFVGWQADPDIHHLDNYTGYADDLIGYRRGKIPFAGKEYYGEAVYVIDNDGDPDSLLGFTDKSPTGALGLTLVSGFPEPAQRSFNWWINSFSPGLDWGPHRPSPDPNTPDLVGYPVGDAQRYRMMANGEIDYDQVYAGVDMTPQGWAPPPDPFSFAAGFDIVFLYAAGPYTISPGDSVILNYVWFIGPNVHTDPKHFSNTFSFADPGPFLNGLNFGPWSSANGAAIDLEQSGFAAAAPGPPRGLEVVSWTTSQATLRWQRKGTFDIAGYELFAFPVSLEPGHVYPIFRIGPQDSMYTDDQLTLGPYQFAIGAFDRDGRHSPLAKKIDFDLRVPMPVILHDPVPADGKLTLTWESSIYPGVAGYHVERFHIEPSGETTVVALGETSTAQFIDADVTEATVYEYTVTAESGAGRLGPRSNRARGMVMAFDAGPLVIDQTLADPSGLTDADSVRAFWQRVLPNAAYRDEDRARPQYMTLYDLNHYPITIVVTSGKYSETPNLHRLLEDYFLAGGSVLFVGRDLFNLDDLPYGTAVFGPGDFEYDCLGVTRASYAPTLLSHPTRMNAEFVGARSCRNGLPDLRADSLRTGWGIPQQLPPVGPAIPFVGWIEGDPTRTHCLYTFESRYPDTSSAQGKTAGLLFDNGRRRAAVLNFPLEMMEETQAVVALHKIVTQLGWTINRPGDINGDGAVNPMDVVLLISYVFRNGEPPGNPRNADMNADCRVNLIDVVVLVNYLYRGGSTLAVGCLTF